MRTAFAQRPGQGLFSFWDIRSGRYKIKICSFVLFPGLFVLSYLINQWHAGHTPWIWTKNQQQLQDPLVILIMSSHLTLWWHNSVHKHLFLLCFTWSDQHHSQGSSSVNLIALPFSLIFFLPFFFCSRLSWMIKLRLMCGSWCTVSLPGTHLEG